MIPHKKESIISLDVVICLCGIANLECFPEANLWRILFLYLKAVNRLLVLVCSLWMLGECPPAVLHSITCTINAVAHMG